MNITKDIQKKFPEEIKIIGKKPQVVFKLVNSVHDGKKKKPRSWHTPNAYAISDDDGNVSEFLYYLTTKNRQVKGAIGTLTEYLPASIVFSPRGDMVINSSQKDLIIFLLNHPRRAKNKYGDGNKRPLFYLEDKNAEAAEKVAAESAKAKMKKYLYDDESRLPEEDLRTIAKALRVPAVDQMELPLVQVSIEEHCKNNPHKFLQFKGVGKDVKMRSNLQEAAEKGIIKYDPLKRKWLFINSETEKEAFISPVRNTENEMDALISWLKNLDTDGTYGKIIELMTGKIQPTPEALSETERIKAEADRLEKENENLRLQLQLKESGDKKPSNKKPKPKEKSKEEA